jgi:phosphoribosylformylglycinamidine cyclo-ligase
VRHIVLERELDWADPLPGTEQPVADLLLEPHRSYLHAVRELRGSVDVRAMAHITGGGLIENVPRVLPAGLSAVIDRSSWEVPPLFSAIERVGGVMPEEMWRTFNMGVGMVLAVPREQADAVSSAAGLDVWRIGEVVESAAGERVRLG